jgi:hypothetical protein
VAACAAYTLSSFPERAAQIGPGLRAALNGDVSDQSKASIILAMGTLVDHYPGYARLFEDIFESNAPGSFRLAAALALARSSRDLAPERAADVLDAAAVNPGWDQPLFPWESVGYDATDGMFEALDSALFRRNIKYLWQPGNHIHDYVCAP